MQIYHRPVHYRYLSRRPRIFRSAPTSQWGQLSPPFRFPRWRSLCTLGDSGDLWALSPADSPPTHWTPKAITWIPDRVWCRESGMNYGEYFRIISASLSAPPRGFIGVFLTIFRLGSFYFMTFVEVLIIMSIILLKIGGFIKGFHLLPRA